jgi:hypothetical protein
MRAIWTSSDEAVVLADQIKSVEWRSRRAIAKGAVCRDVPAEVRVNILILAG